MRAWILIASLLAMTVPAHAQKEAPLEKIKWAYAEIMADRLAGKTDPTSVGIAPAALTDSWFTSRFVGALKRNAKCFTDEAEGYSEFWFPGQDHSITNLRIARSSGSAGKETIEAKFNNGDQPAHYRFVFEQAGDHWLIDDIVVADDSLYSQMTKGCP